MNLSLVLALIIDNVEPNHVVQKSHQLWVLVGLPRDLEEWLKNI